jgi:hypothetical protein
MPSKRNPTLTRLVRLGARLAAAAHVRDGAPEFAVVMLPAVTRGGLPFADARHARLAARAVSVGNATAEAFGYAFPGAVAFAAGRTAARADVHTRADLTCRAFVIAKTTDPVVAGFAARLSAESSRTAVAECHLTVAVALAASQAADIRNVPYRTDAVGLEVLATPVR